MLTVFKYLLGKQNKKIIFELLQATLSTVLIFLMLIFCSNVSLSANKLLNVSEKLYPVYDDFFDDTEVEFFSRIDNIQILKKLYDWETNNKSFDFIVANTQDIGTADNRIPLNYSINYHLGDTIGEDGIFGFESLQINKKFIDYFDIKVENGRLFTNEDYRYSNNIPIIVGNNYKNILNLGDHFEVYFLGEKFVATVIGILNENSYYNNGYDLESLDSKLILPSFEFLSDEDYENIDEGFMLRLFLSKSCGLIYSDSVAIENIQQLFNEKCYELDIEPYTILGLNGINDVNIWGVQGEELKTITIALLIVSVIITIISIYLIITKNLILITNDMKVFQKNGFSKSAITAAAVMEFMLPYILGYIITLGYCIVLSKLTLLLGTALLILFEFTIVYLKTNNYVKKMR